MKFMRWRWNLKMNKKEKGNLSEFLARTLFFLKGYRILEKNYVTGRGTTAGEIDFIAKRGKTIVFVEVKERKTMENAFCAISSLQQKRIINAAKLYLARHPQFLSYDVRFDAVFVSKCKIKHIPNAFEQKI